MSKNLEPVKGDNLKRLDRRFSTIKDCLNHEYSDCYLVRDAKDKVMIVSPEPKLDTHMQKGWSERYDYVPYWKIEKYGKET